MVAIVKKSILKYPRRMILRQKLDVHQSKSKKKKISERILPIIPCAKPLWSIQVKFLVKSYFHKMIIKETPYICM